MLQIQIVGAPFLALHELWLLALEEHVGGQVVGQFVGNTRTNGYPSAFKNVRIPRDKSVTLSDSKGMNLLSSLRARFWITWESLHSTFSSKKEFFH